MKIWNYIIYIIIEKNWKKINEVINDTDDYYQEDFLKNVLKIFL